jgi:O-antigen/teichoic acid export membrane protein
VHTATEPNSPSATSAPTLAADGARASLRQRSIRGSIWTLGLNAGSQIVRLGSNLVLTHLLMPQVFGAMTLLMLLIVGIQMFSDVGLGQSVIRHPRGGERDFQNTVWTLQVVRGVLIWLLLVALAPLFAQVYGLPVLRDFVPVTAFTAVIAGFASVKIFAARRELSVRRVLAIELVAQICGAVVMIVWSLERPNLLALIGGELTYTSVRMILSHVALPGFSSRFRWDREAVRAVMGFGRWVTVSTATTFLSMQSDRLLLPKLVPLKLVGVYGIAGTVANLPMAVLAILGNNLLLPLLSETARRGDDSYRRSILKVRNVLLPVILFVTVAIVVGSPFFFSLLYDERYGDAAWICPMLSASVWFSLLQSSCDRALLAAGNSRAMAISRVVNFAVTIAACYVGHALGELPGLIVGLTISNVAGHVIVQVALARLGVNIVKQDLVYTAALSILALTGLAAPRILGAHLSWHPVAVEIAVAGAIIVPTGFWAARRVLAELR